MKVKKPLRVEKAQEQLPSYVTRPRINLSSISLGRKNIYASTFGIQL